MKYISTLISVKDMEISKQFYHDVLGLDVIEERGYHAILTGGLALETMDYWQFHIKDVNLHNNAIRLVFEEIDFDRFLNHIKKFDIEYIHEMTYGWGQKAIMFYDPDYHIIEVRESMEMVVKRFMSLGLTDRQVAKIMQFSLEYVQSSLYP